MNLPVIMALDDITVAVDPKVDSETPGGVSVLAEAMQMGRSLGIGMILSIHSYLGTSSRVLRNIENLIVVGAAGEDLPKLGQALGLDDPEMVLVRQLRPGEAIAYFPATFPEPVYGFVPYLPAEIHAEELKEKAEQFLQRVRAVERVVPAENGRTRQLTSNQMRVMAHAGFHSFLGSTIQYKGAGLDRNEGRKAVEDLKLLDLVNPHKISSAQRGGQLVLLEVTDKGWQILTERGYKRPERVTKGGFLHNAAALAIAELGHREGDEVRFEREKNGIFVDVTRLSRDGRLSLYQIGLSDPKREARNLVPLAESPGANEVIFVGKDKAFLSEVSKELAGKLSKDAEGKLQMCCVGDVLRQVQ